MARNITQKLTKCKTT